MTDKEIIIDGVNVCRVLFCKNKFELTDIEGLKKCSEIRDCFYKQLRRKEQECEEYKKLSAKYLADYFEVHKQCEELKVELDLVQRELETYKEEISVNYDAKNSYKQALEQIQPKLQEIYDTAGCGATTYQERMVDEIQNIIDEVKNDN